jgi:hypothetical protein
MMSHVNARIDKMAICRKPVKHPFGRTGASEMAGDGNGRDVSVRR